MVKEKTRMTEQHAISSDCNTHGNFQQKLKKKKSNGQITRMLEKQIFRFSTFVEKFGDELIDTKQENTVIINFRENKIHA